MNRLQRILTGLVTLASVLLFGALKTTSRRKAAAEALAAREKERADAAEARIERQEAVTEATTNEKKKGETHVQQAVERARTGRRDYFE